MSATPSYGLIPVAGGGVVNATADTSFTAPAHAVTLLGGQSNRQVTDGVTTSGSTTVTSATASFNSGDIGRSISGTNIPAGAIITAFGSATSVTISAPATASGSAITLTLGGGVGTLVSEVFVEGTGTTILGLVTLFVYDGTTYRHIDDFQVTVVTPGTTVPNFQARRTYQNLWLQPGWTLGAASTVASQLVNVTAFGENA